MEDFTRPQNAAKSNGSKYLEIGELARETGLERFYTSSPRQNGKKKSRKIKNNFAVGKQSKPRDPDGFRHIQTLAAAARLIPVFILRPYVNLVWLICQYFKFRRFFRGPFAQNKDVFTVLSRGTGC